MSTEKELTPEQKATRTAAEALIKTLPNEIAAIITAWTERVKRIPGIKAEDHIQIRMSALLATEVTIDDFWNAVPAKVRIGFLLVRPRPDQPNPYLE